MRRMTLARWLVVGSLAGLGFFAGSAVASAQETGTAVQGDNTASSPESTSGDPRAQNTAGAAQVGPAQNGDASVTQDGDNSADVSQSGTAESGDSVAGGQVTGVVSGGTTTINQSNTSEDAEATSGDATVTNSIGTVSVGPRPSGADVTQFGDNEADVSQSATAISGDAVAGSQVTGVVTTAGGDIFVVSDNDSDEAEGESGEAVASNDIGLIEVGPATEVEGGVAGAAADAASGAATGAGSALPPVGAVAALPAGPSPAQVTGTPLFQDGDNEADVEQTASATSGDAVAGSQVAGLVASELGSINVSNRQSSEDATADTGDAVASNNVGTVDVGQELTATDLDADAVVDVELVQLGDNELDLEQNATANSGDAVAGSQIVGAVAEGGDIAIVLANDSEDADAESGEALAANTVAGSLDVGPDLTLVAVGGIDASATGTLTQEGDNELDFSQSGTATSGDAVAGGQVVGAVTTAGGDVAIDATNVSEDAEATSGEAAVVNTAADGGTITVGPDLAVVAFGIFGDAEATATLDVLGDNELDFSQSGTATSGDAVAGGQVFGVVASGSVAIVASNTSEDDEAETGAATVTNTAATNGGAIDVGADLTVTAAAFLLGDADAAGTLNQETDTELDFEQSGNAASGDAVAGGQVFGVVSGGDVAIDATNVSEDAEAETGEAVVANTAATDGGTVSAGPTLNVDALAGLFFAADATATGTVTQDGDNELDFSQSGTVTSGDAVAGGQVFGVVATGSVAIVAANDAEDADAASGDAVLTNTAAINDGSVFAGTAVDVFARAISLDGDADATATGTVTQDGDNELDFSQSGTVTSGDAVAGGQVFGIVAGGAVAIDATNVSEDAEAETGDAALVNTAATFGGTVAAGTLLSVDATALATDTVAFCIECVAAADATAEADGAVVQDGDNELDFSQSGSAASGDAVAGGQVFGVVADGLVAIVASNSSDGDEAATGDTSVTNTAAADGGAVATGVVAVVDADAEADATAAFCIVCFANADATVDAEGFVSQEGDNELDFSQSGDAASGDAVAGSQVFGVVGGDVAIDARNVSEDAEASTGDAAVNNTAAVNGGLVVASPTLIVDPDASATAVTAFCIVCFADADADATAFGDLLQEGDNELDFSQSGSAASGDAVAGGQVFGVVADGSVAIVASNTSEDAEADTGDAAVNNAVDFVAAGPGIVADADADADAVAAFCIVCFADADADATAAADVFQEGDNELDFSQSGSAASGDAVAGGQVFGVVATGSVAIVASNTSEDDEAQTGDATVTNAAGAAAVGPFAAVIADAEADATAFFCIDCAADADATADAEGFITQDGDNELDFSQSGSAASGDAVAGGQVFGVVASGDVAIDATNVSEDADAESGEATTTNSVDAVFVGPDLFVLADADAFAFGGPDTAVATAAGDVTQDGDNELDVSQSGSAASGDAVAGGQVTGVVAGGTTDIVLDNNSEDDESTTGDSTEADLLGTALIGPILAVLELV